MKKRNQEKLALQKVTVTVLSSSAKLSIKGGKEDLNTTDVIGSDTSNMTSGLVCLTLGNTGY